MQNVIDYSKHHNSMINENSTTSILFCSQNKTMNIERNIMLQVEGTNVKFSEVSKNLGVSIDSSLRFQTHLNHFYKKLYAFVLSHIIVTPGVSTTGSGSCSYLFSST